MTLKNQLFALVLALAALAPAAARADDDDDFDFDGRDVYAHRHRHSEHCRHGATPPGQPQQAGRYELRTVQKWVEGSYQQTWVPRTCRARPFRHRVVCTGGHYEQQLQPGHYENVEEWVWVPSPQPYQPSYYRAEPEWPVNGAWTTTGSYGPVTFQATGSF